MTVKELMEYFCYNISDAHRKIGVSRQSIHKWKAIGRIPYTAELIIEKATDGDLKAGPDNRLRVLDRLGKIEDLKGKIQRANTRLEYLQKTLRLLEQQTI